MPKTCWLAVWTLTLSPLAAPAQEYTIKPGKPAVGEPFQVKADGNFDVEFKLLDAGGQAVMEKKEVKATSATFREIGLARDPATGDFTKLKRTYKKAQRTTDGDRRALLYQGETVLIEKKGGAWEFQIEGGETLEGQDAKELIDEFNKNAARLIPLFLPKKAVKVDEPWTYDVGLIVKELTKEGKIDIDPAKSTGSGKLLKAYQKDGKQFGVLEWTITLPVTHLIHDDNKTPTKEGKIVIKLESDGRIDGGSGPSSLKVAFDGDIRGEINANGMDFGVEVTIRAKVDEQRTPAPK